MYRRLRIRLTISYVLLSTLIFAAVAVVGTGLCYESMTFGINETIESLLAHALPIVDESQSEIKFKSPPESLSTEWSKMRATVQLYDAHGKLISEYGPPAYKHMVVADFLETSFNSHNLRIVSDPLRKNGSIVGHLQVEVPTETRDQAVRNFAWTMAILAPVLLLVLAISGYIFSGTASKPVEDSFNLLRQFLADAGHELRTPIHLIQLTTENAMIGHESDVELQQDLNTIVRATDRMGRLVEDMMMLAKMEVKQLAVKSLPVRIDELLEDAISEYAIRAKEKGIELDTQPFAAATVVGDADSLHRVIANLIENALRYTDSGGKVFVRLQHHTSRVEIKVQDTGIGIPAESVPLIFNRFYRVDTSRAREAGGTGLGLSIVKGICELHKGNIHVQSEVGKGSTFTVTLPAAAETAH